MTYAWISGRDKKLAFVAGPEGELLKSKSKLCCTMSLMAYMNSGKSSLLGTILGMLNINSGTIAIDGVDLAILPTESVRQRLVAIPQNPVIILGTARLNMDPEQRHDDEQIIEALKKVGLWNWLEDRGGLNAEMTTDSMSQGQQQLLSLARALLRSGSVLLLDEATSNMDNQTNGMVQEIIRDHFASWTVISVSHRLHDVLSWDVVVVIGDGRVVEIGNPNDLRMSGGHFAELLASS
jgi:ATP-binding cassette subfamily C (CFTR/MRP) protein 1